MTRKHVYAFGHDGRCLAYERWPSDRPLPVKSFEANHPGCLLAVFDEAQHLVDVPPSALLVSAEGGLPAVSVDPAWTPPEPEPVPKLVQPSRHDKRWLAQKEAAKALGIPWIKGHPTAGPTEAEAAISAALALAFPGAPVVVSVAGLMASYAAQAHELGLIPEASFAALRDFVAASPLEELEQLLSQI